MARDGVLRDNAIEFKPSRSRLGCRAQDGLESFSMISASARSAGWELRGEVFYELEPPGVNRRIHQIGHDGFTAGREIIRAWLRPCFSSQ